MSRPRVIKPHLIRTLVDDSKSDVSIELDLLAKDANIWEYSVRAIPSDQSGVVLIQLGKSFSVSDSFADIVSTDGCLPWRQRSEV